MVEYLMLSVEYEAEAWETGSRHSDETGYSGSKAQSRARSRPPGSRAASPHSFHPSQSGGDYYRDTNLTDKNASNRAPGSNMSHYGGQPAASQYGLPQLPFMPFGGGPGSVAGSDYGGQMQMPGPMVYQHTGSMYGMMPPTMPMAPRNTVMSMGMFGANASGSQAGDFAPPMAPGMQGRPMSTFSMATSVNPFATPSPSMNPNPNDDELTNALRQYLSTQDLMTVTKK